MFGCLLLGRRRVDSHVWLSPWCGALIVPYARFSSAVCFVSVNGCETSLVWQSIACLVSSSSVYHALLLRVLHLDVTFSSAWCSRASGSPVSLPTQWCPFRLSFSLAAHLDLGSFRFCTSCHTSLALYERPVWDCLTAVTVCTSSPTEPF